jgi:hypothetical protein
MFVSTSKRSDTFDTAAQLRAHYRKFAPMLAHLAKATIAGDSSAAVVAPVADALAALEPASAITTKSVPAFTPTPAVAAPSITPAVGEADNNDANPDNPQEPDFD